MMEIAFFMHFCFQGPINPSRYNLTVSDLQGNQVNLVDSDPIGRVTTARSTPLCVTGTMGRMKENDRSSLDLSSMVETTHSY
ncbi:MAG: hypothetical protein CMO55_18065 [Verrucomicrobiales bacterium]|nr:hypothetical protein [Verrucomicrobiales bacterium]